MTAKKTAPVKAAPAAALAKGKAAAEDAKKTAKSEDARKPVRAVEAASKPAAKGATKAVAAEPVKGKGPAKKNGKPDDKAKKADGADVDLSDVESDLEGDSDA